ncbi:MAG: hypothetical protein ACKVS9_14600 [Phycisphaerae bacterium]
MSLCAGITAAAALTPAAWSQTVVYDNMISTGGTIGITFDRGLLASLGLDASAPTLPTQFAVAQPLELSFVDNEPHRVLAGLLEFSTPQSISAAGAASVQLGDLQIVAAGDIFAEHEFTIYSATSGRAYFQITGSAFAYDSTAQVLTMNAGALRVSPMLAQELNRPGIADQVVGGLELSAHMTSSQTTLMDLESLQQMYTMPSANEPPITNRAGADVTLRDIQSVSNYGVLGSIRGYAIGSHTCNIGDQNLEWTNNAAPGLSMNMYRLHNGRLMQIGQSWVKTACCAGAQTASMCAPSCNGVGGQQLGVGCLDVYGSGWNGGQSRLQRRSAINPYNGAFGPIVGTSTGTVIDRRLQVRTADISTTTYAGALWFFEGVYASQRDAQAGNWMNNATYRRVTVDASGNTSFVGTASNYAPAISTWRAFGNAGALDTRVEDHLLNVPGEGRFHMCTKVTDLGGGQWLYDYAICNLNSDLAGGALTVPTGAGMTVTGNGFSAPFWHSGEIYNNDPWTFANNGNSVRFATAQDFATNVNANAIRWGTMYNFWFTANRPPVTRTVTVSTFKSSPNQDNTIALRAPAAPGDFDLNGTVELTDLATQLSAFGCTGGGCTGDVDGDGDTDLSDLATLLANFGS